MSKFAAALIAPIVKVKLTLEVEVVGQKLTISGPIDEDDDGDPEFTVVLNGAPPAKIEVPLATVLKGVPAIVAFIAGRLGLSR